MESQEVGEVLREALSVNQRLVDLIGKLSSGSGGEHEHGDVCPLSDASNMCCASKGCCDSEGMGLADNFLEYMREKLAPSDAKESGEEESCPVVSEPESRHVLDEHAVVKAVESLGHDELVDRVKQAYTDTYSTKRLKGMTTDRLQQLLQNHPVAKTVEAREL